MPTRVAIGLGSNLGDRGSHLDYSTSRLASILGRLRVSSYFETDPIDTPGPQPRFLNAVAVGEATRSARELLDALLTIELERGRERSLPGAARTLDLDLVLFGDRILNEPGLTVPHPRFRDRRFVLEPLAQIAPDMLDPVTGRSVRELLELVIG
jgi:2-amino-4-hydroxy-6-hydroxymethyldihydropteridine diphosphokinase